MMHSGENGRATGVAGVKCGVLVVDDKELMRDSVGEALRRAGFEVRTAPGGEEALAAIAAQRPDAVVTDLKMPGMTGVELLERIRRVDEDLPVVLMTAFGTIETAVSAMRQGAFDYITKPFEGDELIIAIKRAIAHRRVVRENAVLRASAASSDGAGEAGARGLGRLIGSSEAMRRVREQVRALAGSHGTVLITGESGAGKEVVARAIHEMSPRSGGAMLAVNCAALSESLLESELFGHERGAFTGAEKMRKGRFELADSGTLLLDEVSEVSPKIQAKLLRVLQERAFERVGSSMTMGIDVRVVATSNRDLPHAVAMGEFRQDLYFRLNVLPVHLPSLRERGAGDVLELAEHFVAQFCRREGREALEIEDGAAELLGAYSWPGNVRELQNICERAVVLTERDGVVLRRELLEPWLGGRAEAMLSRGRVMGEPALRASEVELKPGGFGGGIAPAVSGVSASFGGLSPAGALPSVGGAAEDYVPIAGRVLEDIERDTIVRTLQRFNGHRLKTARALGIGVRTLGLKLKKWKEEQLVAETL
ncbi:MAG: sigma-54 dependent transcriptional regulator [Phycisphaerales bacterium]|jgi:DNA-binding NtrC family response regulator|nr:sigma-54 dependent transcriptional regulator [Phycisphaerales bacterium]